MRSPAESRLAFQVGRVRAKRFATGYVPDQMWGTAVRRRWPMRLMCEMSCGPGWHDLVVALNDLLDVEANGDFRFTQVKEKFGQLRAYWTGADPSGRIDQLVEAAEEISASMCETCGADAKMRQTRGPGFGYIHVACDEHAQPDSDVIRVKTEKISTPIGRFRSTTTEPSDE